jgi:ABC-type transport system substrate-binding protein
MRKLRTYLLIVALLFGAVSMFVILPSAPVKASVPWDGVGREWYFDNLDDEDRQKIRQAVDYCIPREQIIEGLHLGFAEAIASPIGVNFIGVYEETIAAREYNPTKAIELLTDVFGYEFYEYEGGTNETTKVTDVPYFKMTLVAPTTNTARSQWASLISYSLNRAGIDTILKWWNWNIIMPRLFLDPVGTGYDYEHGGYDMFFVGYDASPDPTYKEYYDKTTYPPSSNCYWVEDGAPTSGIWADSAYTNVTAMWTDIYKEMDYDERVKLLKEYQQWCYDWVPTCIIRQEIQLFATDINLQGFDLFHGIQQNIAN